MKKFLLICLADKKNRSTFAVQNLLLEGNISAINLLSGIFYTLILLKNNGIVPPCDVLMYSQPPSSGFATGKAIPSFYLSPMFNFNRKIK